jgi:transposase
LALFGAAVRPVPKPLAEAAERRLAELVAHRGQLSDMLVVEQNRLGDLEDAQHGRSVARHVEWLKKDLKALDLELDDAVRSSPLWLAKQELLSSVPGVGKVVGVRAACRPEAAAGAALRHFLSRAARGEL